MSRDITPLRKIDWAGLLIIAMLYLAFQLWFVNFAALAADEFVFARHIYDYTHLIPYRDFPPYKTILGYYILAIPMLFSHDVLAPLFYIKDEIAFINTGMIILIGFLSRHLFNPRAILLTITLLLANQLFLITSSDLRVDLLTAWFSLLSALLLLQNRVGIAGVMLGIAFLISQKAIWYFIAIDVSFMACYLLNLNTLFNAKHFLKFNAAAFSIISLYIVTWSMISTPQLVLYSVFYEAYTQANLNSYFEIYNLCWYDILIQGPILLFLMPLTLLCINSTTIKVVDERKIFIVTYSFLLIAQFILYKQPFPYNFVLTLPAYFLLYSEFFSWLFSSPANKNAAVSSQVILIYLYFFVLMFLLNFNHFDFIFSLIALIPVFVITYQVQKSKWLLNSTVMLIVLSGVIYPLYLTNENTHHFNGDYQRTMLQKAHEIMSNDDSYIAGVPYFYKHEQGVSGLKNLITPAIRYLETMDASLKPALIPSLYLNTLSGEEVLRNFKQAQVKVIIDNYRMLSLPQKFRDYILAQYKRYDGTLLIYAPVVAKSRKHFRLKFDGIYQIEDANGNIIIDHHDYGNGTTLYLQKGQHQVESTSDFRLSLKPKVRQNTSQRHYVYNWMRMFKPILM